MALAGIPSSNQRTVQAANPRPHGERVRERVPDQVPATPTSAHNDLADADRHKQIARDAALVGSYRPTIRPVAMVTFGQSVYAGATLVPVSVVSAPAPAPANEAGPQAGSLAPPKEREPEP